MRRNNMTKKEILLKIKEALKNPEKGTNSMGCQEKYYSPYYSVGACFSETKLNKMSKEKLNDLVIFGNFLSDAFY